jgi:outer membrane protein assembly factor BamD
VISKAISIFAGFMKMYLRYFLFSIALLFGAGCSKFQKIQRSENLQERYEAALKYYKAGDYYRSGILFEEMIPVLRGKKESELVQFYYAYCQYYQRQLIMASYYFKRFYETFPRSEFAEESMFMYASTLFENSPEYNLDQKSSIEAIEAIENFLRLYPETKNLEKCNNMTELLKTKLERKAFEDAKLYYKIKRYKAATITIENFRQDHPVSLYNEELGYLRILSYYYLAKESIEEKRKERFYLAIESYQQFIDKYTNSKYVREAEAIYVACLREIG